MARPNWEYIRVDVLLPGNPKLDGLTYTSRWTLIELWCHCGQYLTDGFVRDAVWRRLGTANARRQLVDRGLARRVTGGYQMHDYLEHQRSRAEVQDLKEKRRKAGSKGGNAKANAKQVLEQTLEQVQEQNASKPVAEAEADIYGVGVVTDPVRSSPPQRSFSRGQINPGEGAAGRHPSARPLAAALEASGVNGKPASDDTVHGIAASIRDAITKGDTHGT